MRYSIVENNRVVNIAEADAPLSGNWQENTGERIGDEWNGTEWVTPTPPVFIPKVVKMAQARKALIKSGISIASVDTAIGNMADPVERELAQTDWEYSDTVSRDSDLVATLGAELGLTDGEIDDLFILADTL